MRADQHLDLARASGSRRRAAGTRRCRRAASGISGMPEADAWMASRARPGWSRRARRARLRVPSDAMATSRPSRSLRSTSRSADESLPSRATGIAPQECITCFDDRRLRQRLLGDEAGADVRIGQRERRHVQVADVVGQHEDGRLGRQVLLPEHLVLVEQLEVAPHQQLGEPLEPVGAGSRSDIGGAPSEILCTTRRSAEPMLRRSGGYNRAPGGVAWESTSVSASSR